MTKQPRHPGELLREDVLVPLGIEITEAAKRLGISRTALSRVLHGHARISANLAVRLERAGVSTARFWMALRANYELSFAEQRDPPRLCTCNWGGWPDQTRSSHDGNPPNLRRRGLREGR